MIENTNNNEDLIEEIEEENIEFTPIVPHSMNLDKEENKEETNKVEDPDVKSMIDQAVARLVAINNGTYVPEEKKEEEKIEDKEINDLINQAVARLQALNSGTYVPEEKKEENKEEIKEDVNNNVDNIIEEETLIEEPEEVIVEEEEVLPVTENNLESEEVFEEGESEVVPVTESEKVEVNTEIESVPVEENNLESEEVFEDGESEVVPITENVSLEETNTETSSLEENNQITENNINLGEKEEVVPVNETNTNIETSPVETAVVENNIQMVNNPPSNNEQLVNTVSFNNVVETVPVVDPDEGLPLLKTYAENFTKKEYVCNPAIGRDNEIKQLILCLLTPEKSGILVGKPGIGKTAIVEGLTYQMKKGNVPDALKKYSIYKLNTASLLGTMPNSSEPKIQALLNEIKGRDDMILFIDEIHTLIGSNAGNSSSMDFAQVFKPGLDRGSIKIIGATTTEEYDKYILTDKAFVRRFQKIDVAEPTRDQTIQILLGSLPKLEHKTGAKLKYTDFVKEQIMAFIVDLTSEYRRVYELAARYPDVSLNVLQTAFSYAVFDNKTEVGIRDVRKAIKETKLVYPDVIKKELVRFNDVFSDIYRMETPQRLKGETTVNEENN